MAKVQVTIVCLLACLAASAQNYEKVPFGDFEQWAVRYVTESQIIGGQEKTLYVIGPTDTVRGNEVYDYKNTIWSTSNAFAKVMGVVKISNNVTPDNGPMGKCAKLATQIATCKVAGMLNIKVLAAGSIYWGKMLEPVTGVSDPFAFIDWGIPFTKRPKALVLNYKSNIPNTGKLVKGTTTRTIEFDGYDPAEILFVLQYRWEDDKGNIHAKRVGTVIYHVDQSSDGWMKDFRIPVIYGDARESADYQPYMDLLSGERTMYAINSKGKKKPILEEAWADADCPVTHAIMWLTSGSCGAFTGALDNVLWVDEIRLEY
ncbi:MAG: PCMD domain-containing protein [Bacteroidales bacterium]|nr:PCMD domain-containing protein [Bacteroidales bacterium]